MKFEEALNITEERNGGGFLKFDVQLGENEGKNIPHFHYYSLLEKDYKNSL